MRVREGTANTRKLLVEEILKLTFCRLIDTAPFVGIVVILLIY
jgi:hypothetical protein